MIIGIMGKARSGKDASGKILKNYLDQLYDADFKLMAYADKLKIKVMSDFGLSWDQVYGDLKEIPDKRYPKDDGTFWTPREILQFIGTDAYRHVYSDFWIKKLFDNIEKMCYNDVIITDVRMDNEVKAVKNHKGFIIKIERNNCDVFVNGSDHSSENSLTDVYDYKLINDGNLEDLEKKIVYFLIPKIKEYFENLNGGN